VNAPESRLNPDAPRTRHGIEGITSANSGGTVKPREVARFTFTDEKGNPLYWKVRYEPGKNGGKKSFQFFHGDNQPGRGGEQVLYNLPRVLEAKTVIITEGEAKADLLNSWGMVATSMDSGAGSNLTDEMIAQLSGRRIVILRDNDEPGLKFAEKTARALVNECPEVKVVLLPGLPEKGDIIDWAKEPGNDWSRLAQIIARAEPWKGSLEEWPELVPLNDSKAPEIPDDILPGWAGDFTREASRSIQIPYPMALASVLGAVSMAVSSAVKCIHVGPGHIETPNVYLFAPLLSGERKTGMVGAATAPLYEWETEQAEFKTDEIRAAQSRRKTQEKIIEGMRNKAAKTSDDEERRALIESIAAQEVALEDIPHLPRLLADDATPESLPRILKAQGEVLGIISSEGGIFDIFGGRYSRDGIPNLDLLLKAHNGESYRVDRIGRDPIVLNNPRLVVCICPQPDVLLSMADKPGFRGRGLLARFLYLFSESQVGYRDISPDPMSESVTREYSTLVKALLDMRGANLELTISPAARAPWLQFSQMVEEQMRPGGEFEHFRDWAGKLPGQAARLAGVFHCIEAQLPSALEVSEDTMQRALTLSALLADHAKVAFSTMGSDPATEAAQAILGWIQRKERDKFTLRDCFIALQGRYKSTSELKPGLSVLAERGYVRDIGMKLAGGKGRPSGPYYEVNPSFKGGVE